MSTSVRLPALWQAQVEQFADLLVDLGGVAHLRAAVDRVVVSAADLLALDEARLHEVGDDSLRCSLGDPDLFGNVTQSDGVVARDTEEDLRVVRDEPPRLGVFAT